MIHDAATSTAAKSDVPFAPEAVTMLERVRTSHPLATCVLCTPRLTRLRLCALRCAVDPQALEPIFRNMMEAAMQNAVSNGRDSINEADLEVVRKRIKKR
jgi:hypothetical protein